MFKSRELTLSMLNLNEKELASRQLFYFDAKVIWATRGALCVQSHPQEYLTELRRPNGCPAPRP